MAGNRRVLALLLGTLLLVAGCSWHEDGGAGGSESALPAVVPTVLPVDVSGDVELTRYAVSFVSRELTNATIEVRAVGDDASVRAVVSTSGSGVTMQLVPGSYVLMPHVDRRKGFPPRCRSREVVVLKTGLSGLLLTCVQDVSA